LWAAFWLFDKPFVYLYITLVANDAVWREFKAECTRRGLKASQIIEEYMRGMLKTWGVKMADDEPKRKTRK
jgi:hypothetical protein